MSNILNKFDVDEVIYTFMMMSLAGLIIMWYFYMSFPEHYAVVTYLVLAIVFTVAAPALFVYLWFRKNKA